MKRENSVYGDTIPENILQTGITSLLLSFMLRVFVIFLFRFCWDVFRFVHTSMNLFIISLLLTPQDIITLKKSYILYKRYSTQMEIPCLTRATLLSELQEISTTCRLSTLPQKPPRLPQQPLLVIISQSTTTIGASCFTRGHDSTQNLRGHAGLKNSRGSVLLNQRTHLIPKPQTTQARRKEKKEKKGSKHMVNKEKLRNWHLYT